MARRHARGNRTRWDEDNRLSANPWAFLVVGGLVGGLAALVILFALLD